MAVKSGTWTGNSSLVTTIGVIFRLSHVTIHYDNPINNNATVSLDASDGDDYDTVLRTFDNVEGETDNFQEFGDGCLFAAGDEIIVACDVGSDNAYCRIVYEVI